MYRHILVATDGSDRAKHAVQAGAALAKSLGAKLTLIFCAPTYHLPFYPDGVIVDWPEEAQYNARVKVASQKLLETAQQQAADAGCTAQALFVQDDVPHAAIITAAKAHQCDLVVLATHGRSALGALVLGSTTQRVVAHSDLPVLVVR
jgi:nucleotide-binding universal stress UspA family protein